MKQESNKVMTKHFGEVTVGSSIGKLSSVADKLEARGYSIEEVGPDYFTAFLEGKAVVEADVTMSLVPVVETFTWEEYF